MEVSDKENRKILLENDKRQKSPHAVESLLLLDNTLLCNIESDNSIFAPHTCSERYDSSQKYNVSVTQVSKIQMQNTMTTSPTVSSKISQSVSPNINEWQDESLMNQVFAQFEDEREIVLKDCSNINSFDIFNTFCKGDTNSESSNVQEQIIGRVSSDEANKNILCQDKLTNISYLYITNFNDDTLEDSSCKKDNDKSPILKSKSRSLNEYNKPRKQLCLKDIELNSEMKKNKNISPTKCSVFYDLPLTVKKLIQEIKGINELYRKL